MSVMASAAGRLSQLMRPVDPPVGDPQHHQNVHHHRVSHRPRRRRHLTASSGVIRARSDLQHLADRLDPELVTMIVDEADDHFHGRSSSAWAKYADALRKISFARRSSRFPCSSSRTRAASAELTPLHAVVDLRLLHPVLQRLDPDPELLSDPLDRPVLGPQLLTQLAHRAHRSFLLRLAVTTRVRLPRRALCRHDSILVSKVRSLHASQGGSMRRSSGVAPRRWVMGEAVANAAVAWRRAR